ncbi:MAG: hypothetical protein B7733_07200 [Myxococcales bacterium FL481]|nr:MAG: hypothetical protein B7733_07200 [Myxococcales bacterium FL481]
MVDFPVTNDLDHRRCLVGGEPMLFHCHHYNTFLQRTIAEDAPIVQSEPFLVGAAAEVAFAQLRTVFAELSLAAVDERKSVAQQLYRWAGFGTFDLGPLTPEGGRVETPHAHYAMAWKAKFGVSSRPVCQFSSGWLAGAAAAIFDKPLGSFSVRQTTCPSVPDHDTATFELESGQANYSIFESVGAGTLTNHVPLSVTTPNVDYEGILDALSKMPIEGDERGMIPAFGVYLTRHYGNYYNRISFEFLNALTRELGSTGADVAAPLLVEAGHVCAFNTFGGIMTSPEWEALIQPTLKSQEDWVHGIVACVNALGWGRWQVRNVSERSAEFVIHDDYESSGYRSMYGHSPRPVSFLAQGAAAGIMNLVYHGEVASRPAFTAEYYQRLFKSSGSYGATPISSGAMGHARTEFAVERADHQWDLLPKAS